MGAQENAAWRQQLHDAIATAVRSRRNSAGLSVQQVCDRIGCTRASMLRIEEGASAPIHFLAAFAQLVGCSMDDLVPRVPRTFKRQIQKEDGA